MKRRMGAWRKEKKRRGEKGGKKIDEKNKEQDKKKIRGGKKNIRGAGGRRKDDIKWCENMNDGKKKRG